jgi:hypothetical protein
LVGVTPGVLENGSDNVIVSDGVSESDFVTVAVLACDSEKLRETTLDLDLVLKRVIVADIVRSLLPVPVLRFGDGEKVSVSELSPLGIGVRLNESVTGALCVRSFVGELERVAVGVFVSTVRVASGVQEGVSEAFVFAIDTDSTGLSVAVTVMEN